MNTLRLVVFVITGLALFAGCSGTLPPGQKLPQGQLIESLQKRLRVVRGVAASEHIDFDADLDPTPLVGLGVEQVLEAFGGPEYCWENGPSLPPCPERGRWMYSFHHLPEGSLGGGTELALTIGPAGRVDSAHWFFTQ